MFEGDDHIFPNKPELILKGNRLNWGKTLASMVLFIAVFFFLFSENYLFIFEVTAVLLVHELGHFIMMKRYGYKSVNMLFIPIFGAIVSGDKIKVSQRQKFWISIMGPLPGVIMGLVGFFYYVQGNDLGWMFELSLLLIGINLLNLMPLDPLDGGHIIEALFFPTSPQFKLYFSLFSSVVLISLGFYFEVYIIMIFGFFMSLKVRGHQKSQRIQENLDEINLNYKKSYQELSNKEYWTIRKVFLENNPKIREIIPDDFSLWENEKLIVDQVQQILKVDIKKDLNVSQLIFLFVLFVAIVLVPLFIMYSNLELIATTFWLNQ